MPPLRSCCNQNNVTQGYNTEMKGRGSLWKIEFNKKISSINQVKNN